MALPNHRSNQSLSLQPPSGVLPPSQNLKQQRRMTSPANSLVPPDGGRQPSPRPPSPLRNGFTYDSWTGIEPGDESIGSDDEDHPSNWKRSPSPSSSVSNLAASFVQRMNSFVGGMAPRSPSLMPSDAEIEAEAERERERSRREAEAILTKEAQQRKQVEERVLAMLGSAKGLPPPPSKSYTAPTTPSPSSSHKEGNNWWQAAKNRLTPTKEKDPPTPAQQVILEAKAREKKGKGKEEENQWPSNPSSTSLNIPVQPPTRKPVPASPSSPTPSRPSLTAPNLSPSPMRAPDSITNSPSRETTPMYTQFTPQGTLDVPGTLLAIAKRFEKLEKWTIGHVRALEDRMNDVERWLVDKEKDKPSTAVASAVPVDDSVLKGELNEIRDEMSELQGRVGELGREMAKIATSPTHLSSGPKTQMVGAVSIAPRQESTQVVHEVPDTPPILPPILPDLTGTPIHRRLSSTALDTTSPPLSSNKTPSGTKLPYPTGDYNSPPNTFSPPSSPPSSINAAFRNRPISGLPSSSYGTSGSSMSSGNRPMSPPGGSPLSSLSRAATSNSIPRTDSPVSMAADNGLPPPKSDAYRQASVSPTPRKRYTVALGGPIVAPPDLQSNAAPSRDPPKRAGTPKSYFKSGSQAQASDEDDEGGDGGETIGKSAAAKLTRSLATKRSTTSLNSLSSDRDKDEMGGGLYGRTKGDYKAQPSPTPVTPNKRLRAQSAYGFSAVQAQSAQFQTDNATSGGNVNTTAPLRLKTRTRSTEGLNSTASSGFGGMTTATGGKFVDPLVLRRQESAKPIAMPKPGKVPIGQLVAFFDKDKA
ncbi:hypothetical protein FA15DRAFT_612335 [Coprinopsis marcescibilis]|uniref:Uncharacterized protein n=1 Tax=Coprinopsis marcescibilis TaxID=230819 RepID=A0A5C3L6J1_COPMA|nr:hypothetical protein FA15DRAFT_612335 [Coprinopsis marcescibilis]